MRAALNQVELGAPQELSFAKKGLRSRDEASLGKHAGQLWNLVGTDDVSGITAQDLGLFRLRFQNSPLASLPHCRHFLPSLLCLLPFCLTEPVPQLSPPLRSDVRRVQGAWESWPRLMNPGLLHLALWGPVTVNTDFTSNMTLTISGSVMPSRELNAKASTCRGSELHSCG